MTPSEHAKVWRLAGEKLRRRQSGEPENWVIDAMIGALGWLTEAVAESYEERTPKDIPHG